MTEKIDMSLDDIIKMNQGGKKRTGGGGGVGAQRGGRGGLGGNRLKTPSSGPSRLRQNFRQAPYSRPGNKLSMGAGGGKWQHDMFEGIARGGAGGGGVSGGPGHLLVSNLDYGVTDDDLQELFAELGMLRKAAVHYDKSGRSLGTADVVFEYRKNAITAMNQYNGVPLDGRKMKIVMVNQGSANVSTGGNQGGNFPRLQQQQHQQQGGNRLGPRRGGRLGGGGAGLGRMAGAGLGRKQGQGARNVGAVPTAEELDAELDAYVNKMS